MTVRCHPTICFLLAALASVSAPVASQAGGSIAGRAVAKRFANLGVLPAPETVVVEDIVNYCRHRIPLPKAGATVALDLSWDAPLPAHRRESVLQIGYATPRLHDAKDLRPLNLALVIDRSGSMASADKMQRVKQGLHRFVDKLRPEDRISIIAYSTEAVVVLPARRVGDRRAALETIDSLQPGGGTNLHDGLMLGYREVQKGREQRANHRVILLTDGRANQGVTDPAEIARHSHRFNERGIDLSTIGVGSDFNGDLLQQLARAGRGLFHFVADHQDIEKVFVREAQSLVGIVARNVELELSHGPGIEVAQVFGYRPRLRSNGFTTSIENFNYGMTGVVMVRFRCRDAEPAATVASRVRVQLRYTDADSGRRVTLDRHTRFLDPIRSEGTTDHEVRKNYTIAVLADATHEMAEAARSSRYGEAERRLSAALGFFDRHFRNTDDKDLLENRETVRKYRRILGDRIERFRRL